MPIINIGSLNPVKVGAVTEVISNYNFLLPLTVNTLEVFSGISEQPKSLDETVTGAINRAENSFILCDYSFGIESGLMNVPKTKTGYMDVCVCSIYDGKFHNIGLSSAFELPRKIIEFIFEYEMDLNQAFYKANLTQNEKIGSANGAIGFLTHERVTRKDYTKQAIQMALIHLENSGLY